MTSPFKIREIRYIDQTTTMSTAFTVASDAAWTAATKLRVFDLDLSGLTKDSVKDGTLETMLWKRRPNIDTLTGGVADKSFKFKMYLSGGSSDLTVPAAATFLSKFMGGLTTPATAISDTAEAATTSTNIKATAHGQVAGQAVLVGTIADGKGGGAGAVIKTANVNDYDLLMALPGTPAENDVVKHGHTCYLPAAAVSGSCEVGNYLDFLIIGHYPGSGVADDPDQINIIGCSGTVEFGGLKAGELPYAEYTIRVADWRNEPNASKASFTHSTAPSGGDPAQDRGLGILTIGDTAATTRVAPAGGDIAIKPGFQIVPIIDPNLTTGVNGIGGWARLPTDDGPTFEVTLYWTDMPGLTADFTAGTAKQILYQIGHVTQGTLIFDMETAYLDATPDRSEFNQATGLKLKFHGSVPTTPTALTTAAHELEDSPFRLTFL